MPWKEIEAMKLKQEFALRALAGGDSMTELCRDYGISRKTGHKWRERFLSEGFGGLADRSRRPAQSPRELDEAAVCRIVRLRQAHPTWGARKLQELYRRAHKSESLPSESSFKRVLEKAGLVAKRRRRCVRDTGRLQQRREPRAANELWTVDFKGWWPTTGGGRCEPLTIRDGFSRYVLCARPLTSANSDAVRAEFERVFERYGLPEAIRSDNGSPFAATSAILGLSRLSAWWLALGISLDRIDPGRPDQNGAHERMHRDIAAEVEGCVQGDLAENEAALEVWRQCFNEQRPHEALGMKVPASVYERSARRFEGTPDHLEYPQHYLTRRVQRGGTIKLESHPLMISTSLRGWDVGLEPAETGRLRLWFSQLVLGEIDLETHSLRPARAGRSEAAA